MNKDTQNEDEKKASYPYCSLETALKVADAVKSLGGGSKTFVSKSLLASHLKEDEKGQSLVFKIASAKAFGLIKGRSNFLLTELARNYYFPTNEKGGKIVLLAFLAEPRAFKSIIDRFDGSKLPEREVLGNILHREEGVPESWKQRVAAYFDQSAKFAGAIDEHAFLRLRASIHGILAKEEDKGKSANVNTLQTDSQASEKPRVSSVPQNPVVSSASPAFVVTKSVWAFAHKTGQIRIETPENISLELWEKLNAYVQLLKPSENE